MTVAVGARLSAAGDGTTTVFSPTFHANSESELAVVVVKDSDGTKTDQVLNTDYTVTFASGVNAGPPTVTFVTAPASGYTVIITPANVIDQPSTMANTDPVFGSTFTTALDEMAAKIQTLQDQMKTKFGAALDDPHQNVIGDWKDRLDTYAYFNATTGQLEAKALSLIQADLGTLDADLAAIAALTPSDDDFIQRKASAWVNRTPTQVMADLGGLNPDGTVGAPGIAFASDPDSGFYSAAANAITLALGGFDMLRWTSDGGIVYPNRPHVEVYANADVVNQTGNGTVATVVHNTAIRNIGSDYNTTTGLWTAPNTAAYTISGMVALAGITAAATDVTVILESNFNDYIVAKGDPQTMGLLGGELFIPFCVTDVTLTGAVHTYKVTVEVNGEAGDVVDIKGSASPFETWLHITQNG